MPKTKVEMEQITETLTVSELGCLYGFEIAEAAFIHAALTFNIMANLAKAVNEPVETVVNLYETYMKDILNKFGLEEYGVREVTRQ